MKKVLLLNPPGDKKYFRDYYCSKVSKADYYYHPIDLVYLSGTLNGDFDVYVLDCIADGYSRGECLKKINEISPDIVLSLVSSPSFDPDLDFLRDIKESDADISIAVTGDIFRDLKGVALDRYLFLDAVLLDFSTKDFLKYLLRGGGVIL